MDSRQLGCPARNSRNLRRQICPCPEKCSTMGWPRCQSAKNSPNQGGCSAGPRKKSANARRPLFLAREKKRKPGAAALLAHAKKTQVSGGSAAQPEKKCFWQGGSRSQPLKTIFKGACRCAPPGRTSFEQTCCRSPPRSTLRAAVRLGFRLLLYLVALFPLQPAGAEPLRMPAVPLLRNAVPSGLATWRAKPNNATF